MFANFLNKYVGRKKLRLLVRLRKRKRLFQIKSTNESFGSIYERIFTSNTIFTCVPISRFMLLFACRCANRFSKGFGYIFMIHFIMFLLLSLTQISLPCLLLLTKIRKCWMKFFYVQLTPLKVKRQKELEYVEIKRWKSLKHVKRNRKTRCEEVENNIFMSFLPARRCRFTREFPK